MGMLPLRRLKYGLEQATGVKIKNLSKTGTQILKKVKLWNEHYSEGRFFPHGAARLDVE